MKKQDNVTKEEKPKKKKRHFWLLVLILANVLFFAGVMLGAVLLFGINFVFPNQDSGISFVLNAYFPFIGTLVIIPLFCCLFERDIFKSFLHCRIGGSKGNNLRMLLFGLISGFAANGICILVAWLNKDLTFKFCEFNIGYLAFAFINVLVQSGAEELVYRGYMQKALHQRYGVVFAIVANGLCFGVMHIGNPGVTVLSCANITLYGVVMSMVAYYTDSLWFCIANHTMWNFTQNFIFGLPNSGLAAEKSLFELIDHGDSIIYDGMFGVEGGIVFLIMGSAIVVALLLWDKKSRKCNSITKIQEEMK